MSMRLEESHWRSLQDVVGVVLAATKDGFRDEPASPAADKSQKRAGNRPISYVKQ